MSLHNKLIATKFSLSIGGMNIHEKDPRRRDIQSIVHNVRRQGLATLQIQFTDHNRTWRNYFSRLSPTRVTFKGTNADGSVPEHFDGYVTNVAPLTTLNDYTIQIECVASKWSLTNPVKKSTVFKNMSRKQVIDKLAKQHGIKVSWIVESEINIKEEELTLSVNSSVFEFCSNLAEEVGYRLTGTSLKQWICTPMWSSAKPKSKHFNRHKDANLIDFSPNLSPYSFEDDSASLSKIDSSTKAKQKSKPKSKKNNKPSKSSKSAGGSKKGSKADSSKGGSNKPKTTAPKKGQMFYDTKKKRWVKAK